MHTTDVDVIVDDDNNDHDDNGDLVERSGSGVELRTLDYENPGSNPGCDVKTLGKFFHSTLFQFTQLNNGYRQWWICVRAAFAH